MGLMDWLEKKVEKPLEKKVEKSIEKKIEDAPKDAKEKVEENVFGRLCTKGIKDEADQNRCKALWRLKDIAQSGAKAVGSCGATLGIGAVEVGTDGLATPVAGPAGLMTAGECVYNVGKVADSTYAMGRQVITGKETKTIEEQTKEALGTWVKKKVKAEIDRQINDLATSDYRHFKDLNPDATPADFDRINDMQDNLGF